MPHPRMRNISIYVQLRQPGDENGDHPGRYRPAGCGNSNPTGWLLIRWGSWSQRAARVSSRVNVEVSPHPGRMRSRLRIRNPSIFLQLQQPGDENGDPPGRYRPARCGNPNATGWLLIVWRSWSQRAASVAPRDNVEVPPHPGRIGSYSRIRNPSISLQLTPTTWGRERGSPGSILPRTV